MCSYTQIYTQIIAVMYKYKIKFYDENKLCTSFTIVNSNTIKF